MSRETLITCPITNKRTTHKDPEDLHTEEIEVESTPDGIEVPEVSGWGTLILVERKTRDLNEAATYLVQNGIAQGTISKDEDQAKLIASIVANPEQYGLPSAQYVQIQQLTNLSPAGLKQLRAAINGLLPENYHV